MPNLTLITPNRPSCCVSWNYNQKYCHGFNIFPEVYTQLQIMLAVLFSIKSPKIMLIFLNYTKNYGSTIEKSLLHLTTSSQSFLHLVLMSTLSLPYFVLLVLIDILLPMNRLQGVRQCMLTSQRGLRILLR